MSWFWGEKTVEKVASSLIFGRALRVINITHALLARKLKTVHRVMQQPYFSMAEKRGENQREMVISSEVSIDHCSLN